MQYYNIFPAEISNFYYRQDMPRKNFLSIPVGIRSADVLEATWKSRKVSSVEFNQRKPGRENSF